MRSFKRYVGASVTSDWVSATVGALVALIVGAALYGMVLVAMPSAYKDVEGKSNDVALTVAKSVAGDLGRAVDLGIPLDRMRGVDDYLDQILSFAPEVERIAILDRQERVLFMSHPGQSAMDAPHARAPILGADGEVGYGAVITHASNTMRTVMERAIVAGAIAITLLAGLIVAVVLRIVRLERIDLPVVRTAAMLASAGRGHFVERGLEPAGLLTRVSDAFARAMTPIQLAHRRILALMEEIKAVDGSAAVRERVARMAAPLDELTLERRTGRLRTIGFVWWPAAALTVLMATRPLVANFAYDRIGDDPYAAVAVAFAVGAESLGSLLGVLAAMVLAGRWSKPVTVLAMLAAAVAFGMVYYVRDYRVFTAVATFASFSGWLAVWTVLAAPGSGRRRPWRGALVLLAAAAIGPLMGALLAEAEGRRAAFATLGIFAVVLALAGAAGAPRRRPDRGIRPQLGNDEVLALIGAALAVFAWADVHLAATMLRENYAVLALNFGLCGACGFVPYLLRLRVPVAIGAAVSVAAAAIGGGLVPVEAVESLPEDPRLAATSALAGFGFGLVAFALGARAFVPSSAIALGVAGVAAGTLHALTMLQPGLGFDVSVVAAAGLAALSVVASATRAAGWAR